MTGVLGKKFKLPLSSRSFRQIVLWIGANAGGVGKTSLSTHIGQEMARRGYDVAVFDLDTNVSMRAFTGLRENTDPRDTIAAVFDENFDGNWPLQTPEWGEPKGKLQICQGGLVMTQIGTDLIMRDRRESVLKDRLQDYPLPHHLIILDCPASLNHVNDVALTVATHLLIPLRMEKKSFAGANELLLWYRAKCRSLRLNPPPEILGFIPTMYREAEADERAYFESRFKILPKDYHCYDAIKYSPMFKSAQNRGRPLQIHRPNNKLCASFNPVCDDLAQLIRG